MKTKFIYVFLFTISAKCLSVYYFFIILSLTKLKKRRRFSSGDKFKSVIVSSLTLSPLWICLGKVLTSGWSGAAPHPIFNLTQ
jgi:hypothetical protein